VDTPTKLKILHDTTHHFLVNSGRKEKNRAERKSEAEKAPHARHRKKAENPLFDQDS
jgi:hypothetical protein